ncbi:hypothetical protein GCM10007036_11300 [Alsobacter metallidurans]|uniref:Uncharacterized protein n=1 Tax=Alsobacter metallidurans TaxID=340221 RepID=A0A917MGU4_9HYPH|nr:hypothetical protein GCM10007036_11300 [Alsobacter metallidurans]
MLNPLMRRNRRRALRHCEERSDAAIQTPGMTLYARRLDRFAALAMTEKMSRPRLPGRQRSSAQP